MSPVWGGAVDRCGTVEAGPQNADAVFAKVRPQTLRHPYGRRGGEARHRESGAAKCRRGLHKSEAANAVSTIWGRGGQAR